MWLVWLVIGLSVVSLATGVLGVVLISSLRNGKGLRTVVAQRQVRFKVAVVMGMVYGGSAAVILMLFRWLSVVSTSEMVFALIGLVFGMTMAMYVGIGLGLKVMRNRE